MTPKTYFEHPETASQKRYEALRALCLEGKESEEVCKESGFSMNYLKKCRIEFTRALEAVDNPFFVRKKSGPKKRRTDATVIEKIIALRKRNYSIADIRSTLHAEQIKISLDGIDNILKSEGFAPLPKRTQQERLEAQGPNLMIPPRARAHVFESEFFTTEMGAGPLVFLPLIEELGIIEAIKTAGFPHTHKKSATFNI